MGFANFYHQFIPDFSNVAHPLVNLTQRNCLWSWTPTCQAAFDQLKVL